MSDSPNIEHRFAPLAASGAALKGEVRGLASTFGGPVDSFGTIFAPGAFKLSLEEHRATGALPPMLYQHRNAAVIGRWLAMRETVAGLEVEGQLDLERPAAREAAELLSDGTNAGLSIAFVALNEEVRRGVRTITAARLLEVSVVRGPSNPAATAEVRNALTRADAERALRTAGFPRAAAAKIVASGFPSLSGGVADHAKRATLASELRAAARAISNRKD